MARVLSSLVEAVRGEVGAASFILVELKGGEQVPVYDHSGQLLKFTSGAEAGRVAAKWTDTLGNKVQPRRITDTDWRAREAKRMADGTYVPLPWAGQPWWEGLKDIHGDHFPHMSLEKQALIAFTESADKGSADIQTPLKPGRYLEKHFGTVINKYVIRDLCTIVSAKFEDNRLQFATTEEDIEEVFTQGPSSCMSKEASAYNSGGIHPVRTYAAGDLQVAYLRREGRVVARCVVWPEKKLYNNFYGDRGRLEPLLVKAGYKGGPRAPVGARLLKFKSKKEGNKFTYIVPHVDNAAGVRDAGEFLIVAASGEDCLQAPGGSGHTEVCGFKCIECGNDALAQRHVQSAYIDDRKQDFVCKACAKDRVVQCSYTGYFVLKTNATQVKGRNAGWCWTKVAPEATFTCAGTGNVCWVQERVVLPDGTTWSKPYAEKHARLCSCGKWVGKDAEKCTQSDPGDRVSCLYKTNRGARRKTVTLEDRRSA